MRKSNHGLRPRPYPPQPTSNPIYFSRSFKAARTPLPCPATEAVLLDLVEKRYKEIIPGKRLIALEEPTGRQPASTRKLKLFLRFQLSDRLDNSVCIVSFTFPTIWTSIHSTLTPSPLSTPVGHPRHPLALASNTETQHAAPSPQSKRCAINTDSANGTQHIEGRGPLPLKGAARRARARTLMQLHFKILAADALDVNSSKYVSLKSITAAIEPHLRTAEDKGHVMKVKAALFAFRSLHSFRANPTIRAAVHCTH